MSLTDFFDTVSMYNVCTMYMYMYVQCMYNVRTMYLESLGGTLPSDLQRNSEGKQAIHRVITDDVCESHHAFIYMFTCSYIRSAGAFEVTCIIRHGQQIFFSKNAFLISRARKKSVLDLNEEVPNKNLLREVHTNAMIGWRPFARFRYLRGGPGTRKSCELAGMAPALK